MKSKWQPIETAPKDGERILVYNGMTGTYISSYSNGEWPLHDWNGYTKKWYIPSTDWMSPAKPTHWMPLPEPPKEGA